MVETSTFIFLIIGVVLCFGFPIIIYSFLRRKANKLLIPLLAGAVGFFFMQIVLRMTILAVLAEFTNFYGVNIFLLAFILAFSAALFETIGRVLTVKIFMKEDHRFSAGIAHGIGHGGIEAILLVGIFYVLYIIMSFMINKGTFDNLILFEPSFQVTKDMLVSTSSLFLLGGIERVLTIVFHIAMSVLVIYGFRIKKKYPMLLVIAIHTFLDFNVVLLVHYGLDSYIIEFYLFIIALLMIGVIYFVYQKYLELEDGEDND